ncbi:putative PEP-binding protein [Staphylococcus epidermidis]|nr:putative PEP-binding protein [Staphylococcus epidermidis]
MGREEMRSEEAQLEGYKKVVESMEGKGVVVGSLDIGGDKEVA